MLFERKYFLAERGTNAGLGGLLGGLACAPFGFGRGINVLRDFLIAFGHEIEAHDLLDAANRFRSQLVPRSGYVYRIRWNPGGKRGINGRSAQLARKRLEFGRN